MILRFGPFVMLVLAALAWWVDAAVRRATPAIMKSLSIAALAATAALFLPLAAEARPLTAHDLASLRRLSSPVVSADGARVVWQQRETDWAANRGVNALWSLDLAAKGAAPVKIADGATDPFFTRDGALWFLSGDKVMRAAPGAAPAAVSDLAVDGFLPSPAGDRLLVWAARRPDAADLATPPPAKDKDAGSARTYDRLFARHWDTWADDTKNRLFVLPVVDGRATGGGVPVSAGLDGDAPGKPFGGREELAWSQDGRTVYFTLREAGRIEATSTNLDIWSAPADGSAAPVNLTAANQAMDTLPAVSPDGKWLAYVAMARPTYEADRQVVHLREIATGRVRALTAGWDRSVESIRWAPDGRSLFVTALDDFDTPVFRVDVAGGRVTKLPLDGHVSAVAQGKGGLVVARDSVVTPADLWWLPATGKPRRLTAVNADLLAGVDVPVATRFAFAGAGGDKVQGWTLKPATLAAGVKAPVALLIHGGPQGSFGNSWSYRWNPMVFAGAGYGVVTIDFHGSTGHGQAFTDAIRGDWGGKPLEDLKLGMAAVTTKFGWLDGERACALGGSYGGYMTNWIAGNWPDRFKCLVTHAGVFDARAMAYETEELWFDEWEHGGKTYYEDPAAYERWNPVLKVDAWKTPMLVIHGEKDFRIPYTQGLGAFTALQRRNVPSRLVMFPDENHWILKPRNSQQWYDEVLGWLGKWTR